MRHLTIQRCLRANKGEESPRGVLQVLDLWHLPKERRLLQHQQQALLRHPRQDGRQAGIGARWNGTSHRRTVRIYNTC